VGWVLMIRSGGESSETGSALRMKPTPRMLWIRGASFGASTLRHGQEARRPSRSITTETPAKTVDQLDQHYKCSGCNPGKCPDTLRMVFCFKDRQSRYRARQVFMHYCLAV
jgi:hypothetical protein